MQGLKTSGFGFCGHCRCFPDRLLTGQSELLGCLVGVKRARCRVIIRTLKQDPGLPHFTMHDGYG